MPFKYAAGDKLDYKAVQIFHARAYDYLLRINVYSAVSREVIPYRAAEFIAAAVRGFLKYSKRTDGPKRRNNQPQQRDNKEKRTAAIGIYRAAFKYVHIYTAKGSYNGLCQAAKRSGIYEILEHTGVLIVPSSVHCPARVRLP